MPFAVLHSPAEWSARFDSNSRAVLTIGNLDSVHLGHQKILRSVIERARRTGTLAAAITFSPHPVSVLRPEAAHPQLETLEQRLAHLDALGLDAALVLHFDLALAALSPEQFVRRILVDSLRASAVLVGENFRFGHRQSGDVGVLTELGRQLDFAVESIPPVVIRGTIVSSSAIRTFIRAGQVSQAARFLGRPFSLAGEIRPGTGTGRRFVFPTLNLATKQECLPAHGVYATEILLDGRIYRSATNVGVRPTFDGTHLTIESHLFNFSNKVTSGPLEVCFWHRLRDEQKFSGPDALRTQIQRDLARARSFFARLDNARLNSARRTTLKPRS
ncbi:MAG TPA: bifunctional riboflavin kinase/FAD synthetase [Candidatus Dormibacteraeota bacterium]|nr:bifunctional riboflavin kinase/FAD synthetase [Candidatus Dormibacteraeota bacterium]